jgi:spore germination protein
MNLIKRMLQAAIKQKNDNKNHPQSDTYQERNEKPSLQHTLDEFKDCMDLIHRYYRKLALICFISVIW